MNKILIEYDPFVMESRVFVIKDDKISEGKVSSSLNSLAHNVITQSYSCEIYDVDVRAPKGMFDKIKKDIMQVEMQTYGLNKINLESV